VAIELERQTISPIVLLYRLTVYVAEGKQIHLRFPEGFDLYADLREFIAAWGVGPRNGRS